MPKSRNENPGKHQRISNEEQKTIAKWILFGPFLLIRALVKRIPKSKRKMALWSGLAIVLLISAIGSLGSQSATKTEVASTAQTNEPKATTSLGSVEPTVSLAEFEAFVETNFGNTDWISYVTGITVNSGALWIETSLIKDQDAIEPGRNLCVAASMFVISDSAQRFDSLSIRYSSGERMVLRTNLTTNANSSTCDPEV